MSKLICSSAIDGAIDWVAQAEAKLDEAIAGQRRDMRGRLSRYRLSPARHLFLHRREG